MLPVESDYVSSIEIKSDPVVLKHVHHLHYDVFFDEFFNIRNVNYGAKPLSTKKRIERSIRKYFAGLVNAHPRLTLSQDVVMFFRS